MAQPSQALPSWLTLSSTVITETDGSLSTSFATLTLPLTYFGPSIPLGTNGVWTFGGSTSPPSSSAPPSTITSPPTTSPVTTTASLTSSVFPSGSSSSPTLSAAPTATTTLVVSGASSNGISRVVFAAVIAALGAVVIILIIIFTILLLRRRRDPDDPASGQSSSFWNRQTSLFSRPGEQRVTPIWTGWDMVDPNEVPPAPHTPGEGSPRGSGEEGDPFLTRRSIRSATAAEEMTQTKTGTETLVSLPAPAPVATGAGPTQSTHSSTPRTGHIMPHEMLRRLTEEEEDQTTPPFADIRVVRPSPPQEHSPLLPPPRLNPDGNGAASARISRGSAQSSGSQNTQDPSIASQRSVGSLETEPQEQAEVLTARRVRVGESGTTSSTASLQNVPSTSSSSSAFRSSLGLTGLGGRLGRLSWFRRMSDAPGSSSPTTPVPGPSSFLSDDPYTRTPTRSPRRARPGSTTRFADLGPDRDSNGGSRNTRGSSTFGGLGLGLGLRGSVGSRPISSVSGSGTSGNSVYHDAVETPTSDMIEFPVPMPSVPPLSVASTSRAAVGGSGGNGGNSRRNSPSPALTTQTQPQPQAPGGSSEHQRAVTDSGLSMADRPNPPSYDDSSLPSHIQGHSRLPSGVDVLDIPAPPPASPFTSSRPVFPPGLGFPEPRQWRESFADSHPSSRSSAGINIDVLEEEPPVSGETWRSLTGAGVAPGESEIRRATFGSHPNLVHPRDSSNSEEGSLHHLSPRASRSAIGSAPASGHSLNGSNSSRPSAHSHAPSAGSGVSAHATSSLLTYERPQLVRVDETGELVSPPLSAVFPRPPPSGGDRAASPSSSRPSSPFGFDHPPPTSALRSWMGSSPSSSRAPLLGSLSGPSSPSAGGGTITSTNTNRTGAHSSVTTALTDPITGVTTHLPSLPRRSWQDQHQYERVWGVDESGEQAGGYEDDVW